MSRDYQQLSHNIMPLYYYCRKIKYQEPGETDFMRDGICV